jgi:hypothetical protein
VGHNPLGQTVRKLCQAAGIKGQFTNHSLRATTATRGLTKGVPEKFVMERTGHRDVRSLQRYERPDIKTKVAVSKCLDGGLSCFNKETHSIDKKAGNINCGEKRIRSDIVKNTVKDDMPCDEMEGNSKMARLELQDKGYFNNCTFNFN